MNGHAGQQAASHDIASFIYHSGFLQTNFSDTQLFLHNSHQPFPTYSLHALLAARSPRMFDQLKRSAGPSYQVHIEAIDPNLTVEGLNIVLGSLYSGRKDVPASHSIGILAAANLLLLDDMSRNAWQVCLSHFKTPAGLQDGITFLLTRPIDAVNGANTPHESNFDGPYPQYTKGVLSELLQYLISTIQSQQSESILMHLPFVLLKSVLESPNLEMSAMERHNFARQIVSKRKQYLEPGVEESVVMAFGTDSKSGGIEVLKKDKSTKKKALWKASANGR